MIKLITATERHEANIGDWLSSHYLFSFADYYDPSNVQFGPLKVFNDDVMKGKSSLPNHPHAEMEVVTIILEKFSDNSTIIRVNENGKELNEDNLKWALENSGGWANFLACMKAYLEYKIQLRKGAFDFLRK